MNDSINNWTNLTLEGRMTFLSSHDEAQLCKTTRLIMNIYKLSVLFLFPIIDSISWDIEKIVDFPC